ncbi:MAG: molybdenum cofactor guanylyltransferase, partial [Oscillochloris sp.]|nr:molybdenum cofactor guanylyltransferase [Oscillochloris sp.]
GDALVPRRLATAGGPANDLTAEPLLAVYRRTSLPVITHCLAHDERRMGAALSRLAVRYLDPPWWMRFDPDGQSFLNLNRPEDLDTLRGMAQLGG